MNEENNDSTNVAWRKLLSGKRVDGANGLFVHFRRGNHRFLGDGMLNREGGVCGSQVRPEVRCEMGGFFPSNVARVPIFQ